MIGKMKYILITVLALIFADSSAQNSQVLYFMNLPQSHLINPALRPSNSVYIGLPLISSINLNMNNNFVNFSDLFQKDQSKNLIISILHPDYDPDKFLAKIRDKNSIEQEFTIQTLGVGFSVGKDSYIFLDINERIDGNIVLPKDLFRLALKGNSDFVGRKIDLSSLRGEMSYYREVGLGFSRNFTDKLRVGIKGKLLFGLANASIDNKSLGISVNEDYSHTLDANLTVNMSGPIHVNMDSKNNITSIAIDENKFKTASGVRDFFTDSKNIGFGMDIGASYDLNDRIVLSASVTNLGFINWKKDVTNLKADNKFKFSGLNLLDVINGTKTIDELAADMLDSLKNAFVVSNTKTAYTTFLPFGVSVGGSFSVTKKLTLGLLSYSRVIGQQIRESLTFSANLTIGNEFSASLSYTAENHRYDNLGAGIAFRTGVTQFYLLSDRVPVTWTRIKDNNSNVIIPSNWNTVNIRFGMNIVIGNRVREKNDKPMVMVE